MTFAADRRQLLLDSIAATAKVAGRAADEVTLIAVSKGRSTQEIKEMIAAGQRDFGESRVQETVDKWPALLTAHSDVRLHFIGRLQSNKAPEAVRLFDTLHSLDRQSLIDQLSDAAAKDEKTTTVFVQVNIGAEEQKGGCAIGDVPELVAAVRRSTLELAGLMAIPPLGTDPAPYFALLAKLAEREGLAGLSMGMSSDYREAVMLGATVVRVGSALFEDQ